MSRENEGRGKMSNGEQRAAVGQQVVAAREALGWTQSELAKRTGLTDNTIRKVERGEHVGPGTFRKVLDAVGIAPLAPARAVKPAYPDDVELVRDLVGMYLVALPVDERAAVAHDLVQFLMRRDGHHPNG